MSFSNCPNPPPTQMTQRLSVWCLFCLANLCDLDQRHDRVFLYCPACNQARHRFTIRINAATQQPLVHPLYPQRQSLTPAPHINTDPWRGGATVPIQATQPSAGPLQNCPDPHYQSPYGDHPDIYRISPTGYGTVSSEHNGYPTHFSSAHPSPQEPMYGNLVPAGFQAPSDYRPQPVLASAPKYAGVTKPARKKRGRPSKALEGAEKQAALLAEAWKEQITDGAGERFAACAQGTEDVEARVTNQPQP